MRDIKERETAPLGSILMPTTKVLICDMCGTAGDKENEVWEWGLTTTAQSVQTVKRT